MKAFKISLHTLGLTLAAATLSVGWLVPAYGEPTGNRAEYDSAVSQTKTRYKADHQQCLSLAGQARKVCNAQARASEMKDLADAEARYMGSDEARVKALKEHAKADYGVARAKCNIQSGTARSSCIQAAKAQREQAENNAVASVDMKSKPELSTLPPLPSAPTGAGHTADPELRKEAARK